MIDFRYHLVSIIAIFFALAAGIVLGAGPLSETIDDNLTDQTQALREDNRELHEQLETAAEENAYQEAFLEEVTPRLVADQLETARVAIIAMPGAEDEILEAVRDGLERAGAEAELTVRIQPTWTDPDSEPVLDQLATDLVSSGTELEEGDGFNRGAAVLAAALLSPPVADGVPEEAVHTVDTEVVTAYQEAGLIQLVQDTSTAPTLAVVVTGPVSGENVDERFARLMVLTEELRARSAGVVVTGPPSATEGGLISQIRNSDMEQPISTVDVVDQPSGRVAVVFALTEQQRGDSGHYGIGEGADSALPPVPDTAPPEDASTDSGSEDSTETETDEGSGAGSDSGSGDDASENEADAGNDSGGDQ